jgi:hypothetical protein
MMMNIRRNNPRALRSADRRLREDGAPRLRDEVPSLVRLQLDISDRSADAEGSEHSRRVVVETAPALFLVPCGDPRCTGSEHDLTTLVMTALRSKQTTFHGEDRCGGLVGAGPCSRVLRLDGFAAYA